MSEREKTYKNSEVCQKCANCCKSWWIYTDLKDDAIRASWLDTDKISVVKVKEGLWKIIVNIPCKQLEFRDGKYWCKVYNSPNRPAFCETYPINFKGEDKEVIKEESKKCPIIKEVVENGHVGNNTTE